MDNTREYLGMNKSETIEIFSKSAKQFKRTSDNKNCKAKEPLEDGNVLIVGREIGQSVIIGDVVKVTVLHDGSKQRLAIDAPEHIRISRDKEYQNPNSCKKRVKKVVDSIRIGNSVKVSVLQTETGLLRFAIDAPKEISIYREELYKNQPPTGNQNVVMI